MRKDLAFMANVLDTRLKGSVKPPTIPKYSYRGQENKIPSLSVEGSVDVAAAKPTKIYTGDAMIGIAQMAKSNAVPVFNTDHILEIAKMRR